MQPTVSVWDFDRINENDKGKIKNCNSFLFLFSDAMGSGIAKIPSNTKLEKKSVNKVYILVKNCRPYFNLTNIFKIRISRISRRFEIITENLVGAPGIKVTLPGIFSKNHLFLLQAHLSCVFIDSLMKTSVIIRAQMSQKLYEHLFANLALFEFPALSESRC